MHIAEIAPARIRGQLVTLNQFAIVTGSLASLVVGYFLSFSGNWRAMFASACVPVICFLFGLMFVPESPRWLAQKNRHSEAQAMLAKIHGASAAPEEMSEIREPFETESGAWRELLLPGIRLALLVAVA